MSPGEKTLKLASLAILTLLLIFQSCIKYQTVSKSDLTIDAGFVCGWGSGMDSIKISRNSITYRYWVPATSSDPIINKTRAVSEIEWEEILSYVNLSEFLNLDYHSCNVCVDGCDEWISIQNDNISHKITYDKGLEIKAISSLQAKLASIRAEFAR
jgi:sarcosine oxidase delta subunit